MTHLRVSHVWDDEVMADRVHLRPARVTVGDHKRVTFVTGDVGLGRRFVLLRPDGDSTPDQDLKRDWLRGYGKERILFAVDDRQKVVDMWRAEGVVCLQCAAWQEFKRRT